MNDLETFVGCPQTTWGQYVRLSATDQETEAYRLDRLNSVVAYLESINKYSPDGDMELNYLHDHKGVLSAYFYEAPSELDILALHKAWKEQGGDKMEVFYRTGDCENVGRHFYVIENHFQLKGGYAQGEMLREWEHLETILRIMDDKEGWNAVIPMGEDVRDYIGDDMLTVLRRFYLKH